MFPARSSRDVLASVGRLILAFACLTGLALPAAAQDDKPNAASRPAKAEGGAAQKKTEGAQSLTAEEEQQSLGFARSQHPELVPLLEKLKEENPHEYRKALIDLFRAQQ